MTKRLLLITLLLLGFGGLAMFLIHWAGNRAFEPTRAPSDKDLFEEAVRLGKVSPASEPLARSAPLAPSQIVRLAIGGIGLPDEQQNRQAGDLVVAELGSARGLALVERLELDAVLNELRLNLSRFVRAQDAVRAGKLLRADWFLLGSAVTINGTNSIVVRIVDGRTGVMLDAGLFDRDQGIPKLATELAGFVRRSREAASSDRPRVYFALGAFKDLSVNNRQADFPARLRAYLMAAYQGGNITLLEREYVNTLFQEMRLDLAGLTDEGATHAPPPMQSAYWLVDGYYQSYESSEFEVELVLNVRRPFGRAVSAAFRDKPGEPLFREIKQAVDDALNQKVTFAVPTRRNEIRSQLATGRELAGFGGFPSDTEHVWANYDGYQFLSDDERARRVRNVEEAVRAFETVLLLDPTNREARICLATCFRKTLIHRADEALEYYQEVIESPLNDRWSDVARRALVDSFRRTDPETRRRWFENAARSTANRGAAEFYETRARRAHEDALIQGGRSGTTEEQSQAEALAEVRLFESIQSFDNLLHGKGGTGSFAIGMDTFAKVYGEDRALAAHRLAELFPKMKARFPDAAPYLLAALVTFQVETNAPIIAEFDRTLDWCAANPDQVVNRGDSFWNHIRYEPYDWALKNNLTSLAVKILESIFRAAEKDEKAAAALRLNDGKMALAYGYLAGERWKDALSIFESYTNKPVYMGNSGPWGRAFTVVLTSQQAALCREKLGLPPVIDPREFEMGTNCFCMHSPSSFAADTSGAWVAVASQLFHLGFDLRTNVVANLPNDASVGIADLCVSSTNIWIATGGAGLIEFDKTTGRCRTIQVQDGLLMDSVSRLCLTPGTLWIGYPRGLGQMDLNSRRLKSYMQSFGADRSDAALEPPPGAIGPLVMDSDDRLWVVAGAKLHRFRIPEGRWDSISARTAGSVAAVVADGEQLVSMVRRPVTEIEITRREPGGSWKTNVHKRTLVVTQEELAHLKSELRSNLNEHITADRSSSDRKPKVAVEIYTFGSGQWRILGDIGGLTAPPTAIALDGNDLWVGGEGFIAVVDLSQGKVRKLAYVKARSVDRIQVAGGYVWAQYDKHLHRVPLSETR